MVEMRKLIALSALSALLVSAVPADAKRSGGGKWTVKVGPIWNQADAERKCPKAARSEGARWTGQWWTTRPGKMSVCQMTSKRSTRGWMVEAGPIWNQADAETKCPRAARKVDARWTGEWKTTIPGVMSVCQVTKRR